MTWAGFRAAPYTLAAPALTSPRAYAWPSPRLAPVTRATDPAIFMGVLLALSRDLAEGPVTI